MKTMLEQLGLKALHQIDPETAHGLALAALRTPFVAQPGPVSTERLRTSLAGMELPNPVGLAAGFDKNATAIAPLSRAGFGWPEPIALTVLGASVLVTVVISGVDYVWSWSRRARHGE